MNTETRPSEVTPELRDSIFKHEWISLSAKGKLELTDEARGALKSMIEQIESDLPDETWSGSVQDITVAAVLDTMISKEKSKKKIFWFLRRAGKTLEKGEEPSKKVTKTLEHNLPKEFWHLSIVCLDTKTWEERTLPVPLIIRKKLRFKEILESFEKRLDMQEALSRKK